MWTIISSGHKNPEWINQAIQHYNKLLKLPYKINYIYNSNYKIQQPTKSNYLIGLDPMGVAYESLDFAKNLSKISNNYKNINFIIGGAAGLEPTTKSQCHALWSLSNLTFPHKLAIVILTEQLYRTSCILTNHPYHK